MIVMKEFVSLGMISIETRKLNLSSSYNNQWLPRGIIPHLKHESYRLVLTLQNCVDWIRTRRKKKVTSLKMGILRKLARKLKKVLFLGFMTTFYNFALQLVKNWAEIVVKLNLETRNTNDASIYVCMVYMYRIYVCMVCLFSYKKFKKE